MGRKVGTAAATLLLLLTLGVANAGGRTLAVTTVTVQVIGIGTVTSNPAGLNCGNGSSTCYLAFSGSGSVTLTAAPATGWTFGSWTACPTPPVGNTCSVPVNGNDHEVTANFNGPPTTTSTLSVTWAGHGDIGGGPIDCGDSGGTDCTWTVLTGSTLTVLETPVAGNIFSGWTGACTGTSVACTVPMGSDRSVNASWASAASETHLLAVSISGAGSIKGGDISCPPTCTGTEAKNATVTLTATADEGYTFNGWTGDCSGSAPTCSVTMNADKTVGATFVATPRLTVTVSGNGNVSGGSGAINCGSNGTSCSATFPLNGSVTLTASPALGATFLGWSGACGGTALNCTVLMNAPKSVTATFSSTPAPLTVSVSGKGTVTGGGINCGNGATACSADEPANANITLTATPAAGATFTGWGGACSGTATTCVVSMTGAKNVSASFAGGTSTFTLTVSVSGSGIVVGGGIRCGNGATSCSTDVTANSNVVLTASPASGKKFIGWRGACTGTKTTCTVTMDSAKTVTATFSGTSSSVLTPLGSPQVKRFGAGFLVTLRFRTTLAGTARVRALRAGRIVKNLSRKVAVGADTVGPFSMSVSGLYTFEVELGGHKIHWRACLGRCGASAPARDFVLTRETPSTKRSGDAWSVTLHLRASLISEARVRAYRGTKLLVDKHFLAGTGQIVVGPFLLGPGRYTLRLTATDPYGRVRSLSWIVALAR